MFQYIVVVQYRQDAVSTRTSKNHATLAMPQNPCPYEHQGGTTRFQIDPDGHEKNRSISQKWRIYFWIRRRIEERQFHSITQYYFCKMVWISNLVTPRYLHGRGRSGDGNASRFFEVLVV